MFQDARAFVRALAGGGEPAAADTPAHAVPVLEGGFDHIVMNLPASAVLFLGESARTFETAALVVRPAWS
jgi:tRNA G37 N-methylase Trm5